MEKFGIENVKKFIAFGVGLGMSFEDALKDGKITLKDYVLFVDDVMKIPGIVGGAKHLKEELTDFTPEERAELIVWFKDEFDIENDKVEEVIEKAIDAATGMVLTVDASIELAKAIKALKV